jgi:hypothetical protein
MTYSDFTLDTVLEAFQVTPVQAELFPDVPTLDVPSLLQEVLDEGLSLAYISDKARSEIIIMPILSRCENTSAGLFQFIPCSPEQLEKPQRHGVHKGNPFHKAFVPFASLWFFPCLSGDGVTT